MQYVKKFLDVVIAYSGPRVGQTYIALVCAMPHLKNSRSIRPNKAFSKDD